MSHHEKPAAAGSPLTREHVQAWLDAYSRAWETYDPAAIAPLFSADAVYAYHPYDTDPVRGRDEIVRAWVAPGDDDSSRDAPGTYLGEYTVFAVDGSRAVATGTSTYWKDASRAEVDRIYYNAWLLEFDADGACRSFIEYYMKPRDS
ncbi:MAG TPA: nuclear transport factor 2 family protein [Candidatus Limnocylindrales bacterium]|nr:nuclear transport factor 2 family protein [Candidatus Limnocylindrales bacterium]